MVWDSKVNIKLSINRYIIASLLYSFAIACVGLFTGVVSNIPKVAASETHDLYGTIKEITSTGSGHAQYVIDSFENTVELNLYDEQGNQFINYSDEYGNYSFNNLTAGTYLMEIEGSAIGLLTYNASIDLYSDTSFDPYLSNTPLPDLRLMGKALVNGESPGNFFQGAFLRSDSVGGLADINPSTGNFLQYRPAGGDYEIRNNFVGGSFTSYARGMDMMSSRITLDMDHYVVIDVDTITNAEDVYIDVKDQCGNLLPGVTVAVDKFISSASIGHNATARIQYSPSPKNTDEFGFVIMKFQTQEPGGVVYARYIETNGTWRTTYVLVDRVDLSTAHLSIVINLTKCLETEPTYECQGYEATIIGTESDDELIGTDGVDVIMGLGGDDYIQGLGSSDIICGGDGNDTILGGQGMDTIYGGEGDDTIHGNNNPDIIIDNSGNNYITGGSGADEITVGDGNDTIYGGFGDDTIFAGGGNDSIEGQDGDDYIDGESGSNDINGGDGTDTCYRATLVACEIYEIVH